MVLSAYVILNLFSLMANTEKMGYDALMAILYGNDESNTNEASSTSEAKVTSMPTRLLTNCKVWITYWELMQMPDTPDVQEVKRKQFEDTISRLSPKEVDIYLSILKKRKAELV